MKSIKSILSISLITAFCISLLSGCGRIEETSTLSISTETTAATTAETTEETQENRVEAMVNSMTLEEKVGQMMIPSFRIWQDLRNVKPESGENGETSAQEPEKIKMTELNDEVRQCLENNHFGGVLLFAENFKDAEQTYRLICDLQSSNQKGSSIPLFVAADQEGGSVARIGFGTYGIGNMALAATGDPESAKEMAAIYGTEMQVLGLNMDFAPVVDINNNPANPVIGVRSFSDDPKTVAVFGTAYMNGLTSTGTVATFKHFPGHGDTVTDSHTGFPVINKTYDELKSFELIPYEEVIANGAEMIMTAHIQYPEIEKETYVSVSTGETVYLPATMSKTILTDILKGDMGFEGVIVTDALDMAAIKDNFAFEDTICITINAGVDMIILPVVTDTDYFEITDSVVGLTVGLVNDGKISEDRINDAVTRILTLKEKHGLLDKTDFTVKETEIKKINALFEDPANREKSLELAEKSLTLLKNENDAYPLSDSQDESTLILFADSCASRAGYGELVKQSLRNENITVMVNSAENGEECIDAALEADNVILISRAYNYACLDPETGDGFSTAVFDEIIAKRHETDKTVIVISCQLPYDAARFPDADAIILCFWSSPMRTILPETGEGSAYSPNLEAAITACFEGRELTGKLPVNIPVLSDDYKFTDEVLFERG